MTVCKDWGKVKCASSSPTCWLKPGQDSKTKCGWTDADGYKLTAGWWGCEVRKLPTNYFPAGSCLITYTGPAWVKVGGADGGKRYVKVWFVG